MKLTGSQIVCEVLLDHGVDTVFGYLFVPDRRSGFRLRNAFGSHDYVSGRCYDLRMKKSEISFAPSIGYGDYHVQTHAA